MLTRLMHCHRVRNCSPSQVEHFFQATATGLPDLVRVFNQIWRNTISPAIDTNQPRLDLGAHWLTPMERLGTDLLRQVCQMRPDGRSILPDDAAEDTPDRIPGPPVLQPDWAPEPRQRLFHHRLDAHPTPLQHHGIEQLDVDDNEEDADLKEAFARTLRSHW